jgi:hypothetical protein
MAANQKHTVDKTQPSKDPVKLKADQLYTIIGAGQTGKKGKAALAEGVEYEVPGADAELIVNAGRATLKEK